MHETLDNNIGHDRKTGLWLKVFKALGWRAASEDHKPSGASSFIKDAYKRNEDILNRREPLEARQTELNELWAKIDEIIDDEPLALEGLPHNLPEGEFDAVFTKVKHDEIAHELRAISGKVKTPLGEADYTIIDDKITLFGKKYNENGEEVRFKCDSFSKATDLRMPTQIYDPKIAALKYFYEILNDFSQIQKSESQSTNELAA